MNEYETAHIEEISKKAHRNIICLSSYSSGEDLQQRHRDMSPDIKITNQKSKSKMCGIVYNKGVDASIHRKANAKNKEYYHLGISIYDVTGFGTDDDRKIDYIRIKLRSMVLIMLVSTKDL